MFILFGWGERRFYFFGGDLDGCYHHHYYALCASTHLADRVAIYVVPKDLFMCGRVDVLAGGLLGTPRMREPVRSFLVCVFHGTKA